MITTRIPRSAISPILFSLFTLLIFCPWKAVAGEPVTCKYVHSSGSTINLEMTVTKPAPSNLILQQHFPPGTKIVSTSPRAKKISSKSGEVKWLFKGLSPGKINIIVQVRPPVPAGTVSGSFRYRLPNGSLKEGKITAGKI